MPLSFKISDKGGVSVYGLQRFPVTLYANQWEQLIAAVPDLSAFLLANKGSLAAKPIPKGAVPRLHFGAGARSFDKVPENFLDGY